MRLFPDPAGTFVQAIRQGCFSRDPSHLQRTRLDGFTAFRRDSRWRQIANVGDRRIRRPSIRAHADHLRHVVPSHSFPTRSRMLSKRSSPQVTQLLRRNRIPRGPMCAQREPFRSAILWAFAATLGVFGRLCPCHARAQPSVWPSLTWPGPVWREADARIIPP
jgi:hypothetical protein